MVEGDCAEELLQLSKTTVEEYFLAPPGKNKPHVIVNISVDFIISCTLLRCQVNTLKDDVVNLSLFGSLTNIYCLTTGNIPLPKQEERAAMLKHSEI